MWYDLKIISFYFCYHFVELYYVHYIMLSTLLILFAKSISDRNEVARLMNHTMSPPPTIIKNDNKRTISSSSEGSTRGELKTPLL